MIRNIWHLAPDTWHLTYIYIYIYIIPFLSVSVRFGIGATSCLNMLSVMTMMNRTRTMTRPQQRHPHLRHPQQRQSQERQQWQRPNQTLKKIISFLLKRYYYLQTLRSCVVSWMRDFLFTFYAKQGDYVY